MSWHTFNMGALSVLFLMLAYGLLGGFISEGLKAFRRWRHVQQHRKVQRERERVVQEGRKAAP